MGALRGAAALGAFVGITLAAIPVQIVNLRLPGQAKARFPARYHRLVCRVLGVRVTVKGVPMPEGPSLIVANHVSWLDMPVMGSLKPLSFVAKAQVKTWPGFGLLAELQRTVFVARERRSETAEQRDRIRERLEAGDTLVLFAEGTSGDGNRVLPFKSALMSAAEAQVPDSAAGRTRVRVQPVSISYTAIWGLPMGREYRPLVAWYGDMDLVPHLWELLCKGPVDAVIEFHEPLTIEQAGSRKALAQIANDLVVRGVAAALTGRPQPAPALAPPDQKAA